MPNSPAPAPAAAAEKLPRTSAPKRAAKEIAAPEAKVNEVIDMMAAEASEDEGGKKSASKSRKRKRYSGTSHHVCHVKNTLILHE